MRLLLNNIEYWIKDGIELPTNFNSMADIEKWSYIYRNKLLHRENAPAIIKNNQYIWVINGKTHRIDGPAISWNEFKNWRLNGKDVSREVFEKIQGSSKEGLLVYMINPEYKDYLPLIEYRLSL